MTNDLLTNKQIRLEKYINMYAELYINTVGIKKDDEEDECTE